MTDLPALSLPAEAEVVAFSDAHLNRNRSYAQRKFGFIKAIMADPRVAMFIINGDLADNQFGHPDKIISANQPTFDLIKANEGRVAFLEGNHDPLLWWDGELDKYVPPYLQFKRTLIQIGSTVIRAEHGNAIQPALHEKLPWLPKHPVLGYIGLHGGSVLTLLLKNVLRLKAGFLPANTFIFEKQDSELEHGVWGLYGHTHNAQVAERNNGSRAFLVNSGSIGNLQAEFARLTKNYASIITLYPDP